MSAAIGSGIQLCSLCAIEECQTKGGEKCVFPFIYNETTYNGCAMDGLSRDHAWCATSVNDNGIVDGHWGYCKAVCPRYQVR